jgi:hypothetical protein
MTKESSKPNQESGNTTGDNQITLDSDGIPILKEIVAPKSGAKPDKKETAKKASESSKRNLSLPNNEILVNALRNQLRSQVNKDINNITDKVANSVISSISPMLEEKIKAELAEILQKSLDQMINKAITNIPKSK